MVNTSIFNGYRKTETHIAVLFLFLVAAISSSAAQSPPASATAEFGVVTASSLNVRAGQSLNSQVLGALPRGARIEVMSVNGDWAHIRHDAMTGWVYSRYIELGSHAWVVAAIINIREQPSLNAQVVYQLERGEEVKILQKNDAWYQVQVNGHIGWVYESLLSTSKPVFSAPDVKRRQTYLDEHPELPRVIARAIAQGNFLIGMSTDEVRASLGEPQSILPSDEQSLHDYQWIYNYVDIRVSGSNLAASSRRVYLNFSKGYLTSWGLYFPTAENLQ